MILLNHPLQKEERLMKVVLAPDSFKESLTATEAANIMKEAIIDLNNDYQVSCKPMADGGEGTLDAIMTAAGGERIRVKSVGALGNEQETNYGIVKSNRAIIELAEIAGLAQVPQNRRNPDNTTTRGLGLVILDALDRDCKSLIIGLGGSATNDGGLGMLIALGMKAWDETGEELEGFGRDVHRVHKVSFEDLDNRLQHVDIQIASDVNNPLCGEQGASVVFGPQKGATEKQIKEYDQALEHYSDLLEGEIERKIKTDPGTGAAGGLGFALKALQGKIVSGAALIADILGLEDTIKNADLVITGEGKSDEQTLTGKVPGYIASIANNYNVPVILLSGSIVGNFEKLRSQFTGCFSIINEPMALEEAIENASELLYQQTKHIIHFIDDFNLSNKS
jgi:glycerate kinase